MPIDWEAHTCSWYCHDGQHAFPVLAQEGVTQKMIAVALTKEGVSVVQVVPAREANISTWLDEMGPRPTGHARDGQDSPVPLWRSKASFTVPFLVFVRRQEGARDGL